MPNTLGEPLVCGICFRESSEGIRVANEAHQALHVGARAADGSDLRSSLVEAL